MRVYFSAAACAALVACGGGEDVGSIIDPPPARVETPLPVSANLVTGSASGPKTETDDSEVGAGSFTAFFNDNTIDQQAPKISGGSATADSGRLLLFSNELRTLVVQLENGDQLTFELVGAPVSGTTNASGSRTMYTYREVGKPSDQASTVSLTRFSSGVVEGVFTFGTLTAQDRFSSRLNFNYGWPIDRAALQAKVNGTATYMADQTAALTISDGRRLFAGRTELLVDAAGGSVNGILFDNTGRGNQAQQGLEAIVDVNNATIAADGSISGAGANTIGVTFVSDTRAALTTEPYTPYDVNSLSIDSGSVDGQFVGSTAPFVAAANDPDSLIGSFSATGTIDRVPSAGLPTEDITITGSFRAPRR